MKPSYQGLYHQKGSTINSGLTKKVEKPAMPASLLKKPQTISKPVLPTKHAFMCGSNLNSYEIRG